MSYNSSDPEQPQERFQYDDSVAVQQWTHESTQQAQQAPIAGNPDIPPSRPASVMSLPSLPDRPRHQQQGAQDALDPQHPRAHWETVGGETHAGEYSQNFNSSNSSDPTSLSGEGIKMTPLRGRGRGRGGTTRGGGASGGQGSSSQQQERQQQHQAPEQASPPAGSQAQDQDPYIQQQPMVYVQPGAEPPTEPDPALTEAKPVKGK